ncbi:hypothetical protein F5B22DRAFT_538405 [Xylaria bambusicola]|uniref:uncharacterized protein n=1 Tax=Xylaria bambusicola TaxID=326684 RepID=UPI002007D9D1|nr:uncharacterized protein F5B22DRAFT_538405 [Xylaria bambusicola]KAI0505127.1 hypothetical protein F5B22DRAFT_538405 [Xylaria bambusicola]
MSSPLSFGDALALVQVALELYNQIRDGPELLRNLGEEMKSLELFILSVKELVNEETNSALARLRPMLTEQARADIKNLEKSARPIKDLFWKYTNDQGPFGVTFRFKTATDIYFALGYNKETLNEMRDTVDRSKQKLMQTLQLMGIFGTNALLSNIRNNNPPPQAGPKLRVDQQDGANHNAVGVIYVDPYNLGRSRVSEAYTKLAKEWTVGTGGKWPVAFAHSAGFFVRDRSDCIDILERLTLQSTQDFSRGNKLPAEVAMAALFENKFFNYPYKAKVKDAMMAQRSRGITKNIFKVDYILVFTRREYNNLLQLRKALLGLYGTGMVPEGKGRIVHLGQYLAQGKTVEIVDAMKDNNGNPSRENWNKTVGEIKTAIKGFLKEELNWKQPERFAKQS